jgi:retinol dehydrogenase-12
MPQTLKESCITNLNHHECGAIFLSQCLPPKPTFSVDDIPDLTGKVIMVTGGNAKETIKVWGSGAKFSCSELLQGPLQNNAAVYLAAQSPSKAKESRNSRLLLGKKRDFCDLKSIKESA